MGEVLGVIIAPGIITSLNSLVKQTAQLPEIELTKPKSSWSRHRFLYDFWYGLRISRHGRRFY
jgi:pantothenate kinase type III